MCQLRKKQQVDDPDFLRLSLHAIILLLAEELPLIFVFDDLLAIPVLLKWYIVC